ncbi:unnamed protein product [Trichobilharzia szidati]|nr:unnamed protein product [Trichobilharzia szidati]
MLDELVKTHLDRIQKQLDNYRRYPQQTDDKMLENHLELNYARYHRAYEKLKALKQPLDSDKQSTQMTSENPKGDMDNFMKFMMLQQLQQQNVLWQSALLKTFSKEDRIQYMMQYPPMDFMRYQNADAEKKQLAIESKKDDKRSEISRNSYVFQDHENARRLRIFGYIELFAIIMKKSVNQPPFSLSKAENFGVLLRHSIQNAADYLTNVNNSLGSKLELMNSEKGYQFHLLLDAKLDRNKKKTLKTELLQFLDCILTEITRNMSYINLTESNTLRAITLLEAKLLLFGLIFLRVLILKLFLGYELGSSSEAAKQNRVSMCRKVIASVCVYIYRKIMTEIISERVRKSQVPIPTEIEAMILNDTEMKEVYRIVNGATLTNFIVSQLYFLYCVVCVFKQRFRSQNVMLISPLPTEAIPTHV